MCVHVCCVYVRYCHLPVACAVHLTTVTRLIIAVRQSFTRTHTRVAGRHAHVICNQPERTTRQWTNNTTTRIVEVKTISCFWYRRGLHGKPITRYKINQQIDGKCVVCSDHSLSSKLVGPNYYWKYHHDTKFRRHCCVPFQVVYLFHLAIFD